MKKLFLFLVFASVFCFGHINGCFAADGVNVKLVDALSSAVTVSWNVNGGSKEEAAKYKYDIGLYTSPECTDENLFVSWLLEDEELWKNANGKVVNVAFTFSGLTEDTPYWVKVGVIGDDSLCSEPFAVRTAPFKHVVTAKDAGTAKVGDVLVAEDFSGLVHGGDVAHRAAGVSPAAAGYRNELVLPKGKNPTNLRLAVVPFNKEINIFIGKGVTEAYTKATGLGDWCIGTEVNVSSRPGYVKIGGGKGAYGYLATPELSAIPDGKSVTVKVDFSAKPYDRKTEDERVLVGIVDNVKVGKNQQVAGWYKDSDSCKVKKGNFQYVSLVQEHNTFHDYSITFSNVTNKSRIRFSSDNKSEVTRFLLNYVVVTIIEE